jgi:hypothetical protein
MASGTVAVCKELPMNSDQHHVTDPPTLPNPHQSSMGTRAVAWWQASRQAMWYAMPFYPETFCQLSALWTSIDMVGAVKPSPSALQTPTQQGSCSRTPPKPARTVPLGLGACVEGGREGVTVSDSWERGPVALLR